ncbi:transposase [Candidatus Saccharibacteria bacterium]|nr:transposase [Candidatus Saccharibacteria bacterium]
MSRPTKYNQETTSEFLKLVEEGYTVKLACKKTGITDMTLSRWKKRYPDFLDALNKATSKQWINIDNLHRSGIRVYKRKTNKLPSFAEKPLESGLNASQNYSIVIGSSRV